MTSRGEIINRMTFSQERVGCSVTYTWNLKLPAMNTDFRIAFDR